MRDERALRALGARGEIRIYNSGKSISQTAQELVQHHRRVILLLDWDRTGGHLVRRLLEHLHAQLEVDLAHRKELALTSGVRSVEDLPSALAHARVQAERRIMRHEDE